MAVKDPVGVVFLHFGPNSPVHGVLVSEGNSQFMSGPFPLRALTLIAG